MNEKKTRPYWHVDLKWIFGLIFGISLALTFCAYNLAKITEKKNATEFMTIVVASVFSRSGLDDTGDTQEVLNKIRSSADGKFYPIPGADIWITEKDVLEKTPRELRLQIFSKVVEPYYTGNFDIPELNKNPELKEKVKKEGGLLTIANEDRHNLLEKIFQILLIISIVSLIPFILFSHRFGKMFNPGFVLVFISLAPFSFFSILGILAKQSSSTTNLDSGFAMAGYVASNAIPLIFPILANTYKYGLLAGIGLIVASGIGKIILKFTKDDTK